MKRFLPYLQYVWRITYGYRHTATLRTLLGVVKVLVMLLFVWLSKTAIDCATSRGTLHGGPRVMTWFGFMIVCMLVDLVMAQCIKYMETRSQMRMSNSLNRRLFNVLMTMPLRHGGKTFHSGDMLNRLTLDVRTVTTFVLNQLPSVIVMTVQLGASFAFLAWINPWLALAPMVVMPLCVVSGRVFVRKQRALTAKIRQGESDIQVSIQEGLRHRIVLKSLECLNEIDRRIAALQLQLDHSNKAQARLSAKSGAITRFGFVVGFLTAFGWGIFSLEAGVITYGMMTAFLQLVSRIQNPIAQLAGYVPSFISTSVAVDRLREIDLPLPTIAGMYPSRALPKAGVRVCNISFSYDANGREILSNFSHDFKPGSRTMIIGSTGAGKSTLIKLLLGLLSPDSGSIEIYNETHSVPVSTATLCNYIYVSQGNTLLSGSIRDNMLLAQPQATDDQLAEALHTAAADFVFDLPLGLDTACDETGGGLSEGQAQRIAIARTLLRPGSILLLDEFNSALDPDTAATLMHRISVTYPDATIIIIAHHQGSIAPYCDTVLTIHPNTEGASSRITA